MDRNGSQAGIFFENPEVRSVIQRWMLDQVYDRIRASSRADALPPAARLKTPGELRSPGQAE
jgi:hypothetical protein